MTHSKILLQLDGDDQASVFDAVVAIDARVDQLLQYHGVTPEQVQPLVHGAMFTRRADELRHTAIFVGGSDVAAGERLLAEVRRCFFGALRVSVMLDASGANTTAAAAVLAAARHVALGDCQTVVLAATGPVGQRAARLLARLGARVRVASRSQERADNVCRQLADVLPDTRLEACQTRSEQQLAQALDGAAVVIAAGAAGVELLSLERRRACPQLKVAIDLNAVPPAGIEGLEATDRGQQRDGTIGYGAIGVGATKMKIHKAAVQQLFSANDLVLDAEEIFALGQQLES